MLTTVSSLHSIIERLPSLHFINLEVVRDQVVLIGFTFQLHIEQVCNKAIYVLGLIKRQTPDVKEHTILFILYVRSVLEYASVIQKHCTQNNFHLCSEIIYDLHISSELSRAVCINSMSCSISSSKSPTFHISSHSADNLFNTDIVNRMCVNWNNTCLNIFSFKNFENFKSQIKKVSR